MALNEQLERATTNREDIIDSIEREIVGPSEEKNSTKILNTKGPTVFNSFEEYNSNFSWMKADLKEEVIKIISPSRRYAAGMLHPSNIDNLDILSSIPDDSIINESQTDNDDDKSSNEIDGDFSKEEDVPRIQENNSMPSSMGMTFCMSRDTKEFTVNVTGGIYEKHKISTNILHTDHKNYNFNETWWLRTSIFATTVIDLKSLDQKNNKSVLNTNIEIYDNKNIKINKLNLRLNIQCRLKNDYIFLTVTLLNATKLANNKNLNEFTLFQSKLSVSSGVGNFLNYPKLSQRNLDLTDDEWNNELLFRGKSNYAFGHGCSVIWDQRVKSISEIHTTFIPRYETETMTPDVEIKRNGKIEKIKIEMQELMNVNSYEDVYRILSPLVEGYKEWIIDQELKMSTLQQELLKPAKINLDFCKESLTRIVTGLNLLKRPLIFQAFKLANEAILLQQINGKSLRGVHIRKTNKGFETIFEKSFDQSTQHLNDLTTFDNSWRAFQMAFILLSIQSLTEKCSIDREKVDLIWFPTGGGKTEAYLGVAAFQMFYRRLLNPDDTGVDIMMRYTLRLLTADQFQRASRLICAMEYIRRKNDSVLGVTPYSIGIWVGSKTSPNTNETAIKQLNAMNNSKGLDNFIVTRCPWCGSNIGRVEVINKDGSKESTVIGIEKKNKQLLVKCPDTQCDFNEEIPVYFIDEMIYQKKPTFLIGTIDKFVQLTWNPEARELFGINSLGERIVSPPQIIIQDELHLISGPLGSLAGLYEVLIEELCIDDRSEKYIKPKIISATATIKEFEEQTKCLFGRKEARLFPSPGLEIEDSYFSKVALDSNGLPMPGRKYIGVFTSRVRILMAQVMTYSAILQKVETFDEKEKDPFWTLLSFYNSLRDLGAGLNLFNSDIPTYINALSKREGFKPKDKRYVGAPLELTSRKQSNEISKTIEDLNVPYTLRDSKGRTRALTSCLASNIIEVGVDIDRLSLMGIIGQPKMTAQYIQVSGRVGRRPYERPGLIVTVYSNQNSRDKSHFEHFNEYHQRLYAQVETTSLTPFSSASLERGLTAVLIGFLRTRMNIQVAHSPSSTNIINSIKDTRFLNFQKRFKERVALIDTDQIDAWKDKFQVFMNDLLSGRYETWKTSDEQRGLMYQAGKIYDKEKYRGSIPVINSLRSVDAESRGSITAIESEEIIFKWED